MGLANQHTLILQKNKMAIRIFQRFESIIDKVGRLKAVTLSKRKCFF